MLSETAGYDLLLLWTALTRRCPGLQVHVAVENSLRIRERLRALDGDIGVLGGDTADPDLLLVPIVHDPIVLIVAPSHPWATRRLVPVRDLQGQRLILREPGSATRDLIEARMRAHGVSCRPAMEIASNEVIKRAVELEAGVGIMSRAVIRREVESGHLRAVALREEPRLSRPLYLVYHRHRERSPLIRAIAAVAAELGRQARRLPHPR